jgi:spore coat polysaccharide biosynthesis protein SpsF
VRIITCIVARTTSSRLPLKVLRSVNENNDKSMIDIIISKAKQSRLVDAIYLCTSNETCDDILEDVAARNKIELYRGAAEAVIDRLVAVANIEEADYVVRITGDNIFVAGEFLDAQIKMCIDNDLDYCRLVGVPIGATAELIKVTALKKLHDEMDVSVSEYLTLFIFDPSKFKCGVLKSTQDLSRFGITVDTSDDLDNAKNIIRMLGEEAEQLSLVKISKLFINKKTSFNEISDSAIVKLPYDKWTTYGEFMKEQNEKVDSAQCVSSIVII